MLLYLQNLLRFRRQWLGAEASFCMPSQPPTGTWVSYDYQYTCKKAKISIHVRTYAYILQFVYPNGQRAFIVENTTTTRDHNHIYNYLHSMPLDGNFWRISDTRGRFPAITVKCGLFGEKKKCTAQCFGTGTQTYKGVKDLSSMRHFAERMLHLSRRFCRAPASVELDNWCGSFEYNEDLDLEVTSVNMNDSEGLILPYDHLAGLCWVSLEDGHREFCRMFTKDGKVWIVGAKVCARADLSVRVHSRARARARKRRTNSSYASPIALILRYD